MKQFSRPTEFNDAPFETDVAQKRFRELQVETDTRTAGTDVRLRSEPPLLADPFARWITRQYAASRLVFDGHARCLARQYVIIQLYNLALIYPSPRTTQSHYWGCTLRINTENELTFGT